MDDTKSNLVSILIKEGERLLTASGQENAMLEARVLMAHVLNLDTVGLLTRWGEPVSPEQKDKYFELISGRANHLPLQYITGTQEFMSLKFKVNPDVLIPRGDTEILVEETLNVLKNYSQPLVVDVGTGSGAIVVSLAKYYPAGRYFGVDISDHALEVARQNAGLNQVAGKINFIRGNLLTPLLVQPDFKVDVVVSNPPYIATGDLADLPGDVRQEPVLALDGGADGLEVYTQLVPQAASLLTPGGHLLLEIGYDQAQGVSDLCLVNGFLQIRVIKDYGNRDRVIAARLRSE